VRLNNVKDAGGLLQLSSSEANTVELRPPPVSNIVVLGNVQRNSKANAGMKIGDRLSNIILDHNTCVGIDTEFPRVLLFANATDAGTTTGPNIKMRRNIGVTPTTHPDQRFVMVIGPLSPTALLAGMGANSDISQNMVNAPTGSAGFGSQIVTGTAISAMGFVNFATGDLRLTSGSPGYQVASGKDVGAPVALIDTLMADVI
jgi:hypothetical protein